MSPISNILSTDSSLCSVAINPQLSRLYVELNLISLPMAIVLPCITVVPNKVFLNCSNKCQKNFSLTIQKKKVSSKRLSKIPGIIHTKLFPSKEKIFIFQETFQYSSTLLIYMKNMLKEIIASFNALILTQE